MNDRKTIAGTSVNEANAPNRAIGGSALRTPVHVQEIVPLAVSMLWIFFALTAYYIIKPVRSTVLQTMIGVDNKGYALLATTAFVGVFAYGYGKVVPRVERRSLVAGTFLLFIACLFAFAALLPNGDAVGGHNPALGYVFFVWVSTFNLMVVSQFWSVASEVWTKEQGVRLFGIIGIGGVGGGIFGTVVVSQLAKRLAVFQMLAISALLLAVCLALSTLLFRLRRSTGDVDPTIGSKAEGETKASPGAKAARDHAHATADDDANPLRLVLSSRYLRLVAAMMLVLNVVNTNNEWLLDKVLSQKALSASSLNEFYGEYFLFQNVLTLGIQSFVTPVVQRRLGASSALLFEPTVSLLGMVSFFLAPVLSVIKWHKIVENACEYSIQSNTRELLYVPTTPLEKYSAKNLNDTFVVRIGDALAAGSIFAATNVLIPHFGEGGLKLLVAANVGLGVVWLAVARRIGTLYTERMADAEPR